MRRVVITGVGAVSPLGATAPALVEALAQGRSAVRRMGEWDGVPLRSRVAAPAVLTGEKAIPRQMRRTMSRLSIFAAQAATEALADAKLSLESLDVSRVGCLIGSTMGGAIALHRTYSSLIPTWNTTELSGTAFFQVLPNTAAINVAQYLGLLGIVIGSSAACSSALQAIGGGLDLIRLGRQDVALCGGAEELHETVTGSFDMLLATSTEYNDEPQRTPRPFDAARDGLVCGEGAGIVVLEEREHALARGAKVLAEVCGYHTCTSGMHMSESNRSSIVRCIGEALRDAGLDPAQVDYVNAHATGTRQGDTEEAGALREVFADRVPVSSLKGHLGHTLGASGAIELAACLSMMERGVVLPTRNLERPAPECEGIWHVLRPEPRRLDVVLKNSFAFGGINACLVLRRHEA
jgi:3-oxoacyl-[acyl-carrier-protein] synthase II